MPKPVPLIRIAEALEMPSETSQAYLDRETGEVHFLPDEYVSAAEDEDADLDGYGDWQRELVELARTILQDTQGRYVELPDQYEIDEYRFLASSASSYPDPAISVQLDDAIRNRGAFRRFKDLVHQLGIQRQWYEYRAQKLLEVARAWCDAQEIPYEEVPPEHRRPGES